MSAIPYRPYYRLPTPTVPGLPPDAPDPQFKPGPRAATPNTWTFPEICAAYQWPANAPGTGVIAIVELGGGWRPADMTKYFASIGQPEPKITDVSVDGTKNVPGAKLLADGKDLFTPELEKKDPAAKVKEKCVEITRTVLMRKKPGPMSVG